MQKIKGYGVYRLWKERERNKQTSHEDDKLYTLNHIGIILT